MLTVAAPLLMPALQPFAMPDVETAGAKLACAARLDAPLLACLGAAIANAAGFRFFSAMDIGGGAQAKEARRSSGLGRSCRTRWSRWCSRLDRIALWQRSSRRGGWALPGLADLFCAGRAPFWLGYRHGASARAFGFGLTFYPTVGACAAAPALLFH